MKRLSALVKVDSKGRVTIPQSIRSALGIEPGMVVLLIGDVDKRELIATPITSRSESIYVIDATLRDRPGALAAVTEVLARHKIDIVASKCASIVRGEEGGCTIIADFSRADIDPEDLKRELERLDVVFHVIMRRLEAGLEEI
ncbi:hypothetical protein apy_10710 [Aeropyrum pernix]|uniref:ACT domain-containing protein n=1 Tax=Aeropyrum pernix TaxID=56636 RepID=A0A401HA54_AERPX|nr:ACT domain-containing protein [Aeropyrum pernix]GBF09346.1 hypothetical protein apy_10710 [Aeropyrum pernix]